MQNDKKKQAQPRVTKEELMGDLSRFTQQYYNCPFCNSPSLTFADQLAHLRDMHPWYSLDIHNNTK